MKIIIQNFSLETTEHGNFNLFELKQYTEKSSGEIKIKPRIVAYGISMDLALKKMVHLNLHENISEVSLQEFLVQYKREYEKIKTQLIINNIK